MSETGRRKGFTLIELAVMLMIVGLLAAGIIAGQSLIRQSHIMSLITDQQRYVKAALAFRDKYAALPGDMANAGSYWTLNMTCPPTTALTTPVTTTCNGNGDGLINSDGTGAYVANVTPDPSENFYAWQQLSNASFIQGSYTGALGATGVPNDNEPGLNVPATRITGGGFEWMAFSGGTTTMIASGNSTYSMTTAFPSIATYQQYLLLGGRSGYDLLAPLLGGSDAASIDNKIDDGLPETGAVITIGASTALPGYTANCVNAASPPTTTTPTYATTATPACVLLFQVNW